MNSKIFLQFEGPFLLTITQTSGMAEVNQNKMKEELNSCLLEIKKWETSWKKSHDGVAPTKADIISASMQAKYTHYKRLKKELSAKPKSTKPKAHVSTPHTIDSTSEDSIPKEERPVQSFLNFTDMYRNSVGRKSSHAPIQNPREPLARKLISATKEIVLSSAPPPTRNKTEKRVTFDASAAADDEKPKEKTKKEETPQKSVVEEVPMDITPPQENAENRVNQSQLTDASVGHFSFFHKRPSGSFRLPKNIFRLDVNPFEDIQQRCTKETKELEQQQQKKQTEFLRKQRQKQAIEEITRAQEKSQQEEEEEGEDDMDELANMYGVSTPAKTSTPAPSTPNVPAKTMTENLISSSLSGSFTGKRNNFVRMKTQANKSGNGRRVKAKLVKDLHVRSNYDGGLVVNTVENPFYNDEATAQTQASTSSLFNVYSHTQEEEEMLLEDEEDIVETENGTQIDTYDEDAMELDNLTEEDLWNAAGPSSEQIHTVLRDSFGFDGFRPGQEEAISRILRHQSSLLIIPTGSGKSLCYQLPALMSPQNSIVLVISPLLSLMQDQMDNLPTCLTGVSMSGEKSKSETDTIEREIRNGRVKIVFISPEKFVSPNFLRKLSTFPPISFICVDEAHCISEWSHNFRTSYMRLGDVIEKLKVKTVLALTATATKRTETDISKCLRISSENVLRFSSIRSNLKIAVSCEKDKMAALTKKLQKGPLSQGSVIVYTMLQKQADEVAEHLLRNNVEAVSYHAGKHDSERKKVQRMFMTDRVRVVVATVAFGMGLDKPDVRSVIHYSLPKSIENYIQEIGRAGRDGKESICHLFLHEDDYLKTRSLAYGDNVDYSTIKQILEKIFSTQSPVGRFQSLPVDTMEATFDVKKEVIFTLLSFLEMQGYITTLPSQFVTVDISFYKTEAVQLAGKNKLIEFAVKGKKGSKGRYTFDLMEACNEFKADVHQIMMELQKLKNEEKEITFEQRNPAFCLQILKKPKDIAQLSQQMIEKTDALEKTKVYKVDAVYSCLASATAEEPGLQARKIQADTDRYFSETEETPKEIPPLSQKYESHNAFLKSDARAFLRDFYGDTVTTGRQAARIFHGLSSPSFPANVWAGTAKMVWGKHTGTDFLELVKMFRDEMCNIRGKDRQPKSIDVHLYLQVYEAAVASRRSMKLHLEKNNNHPHYFSKPSLEKCGGNLGNSLEKAKKKAKFSVGLTIFIVSVSSKRTTHTNMNVYRITLNVLYFIVYLMVFCLELLGVRISSAIKSNEATASDASTEQVVEAKSTLLETSLEDGNSMIPDQTQDEPVQENAQGDSPLVSSKDMQNTEDHMVPTPESSHALQIELKRTEDMFDFVTRLFLTEKEGHAQTRLMLSDMTARYEALSKLLEEHLQAAQSQEEREKPHQQIIEEPSDLDSSHIEPHANETLTNETLEVPTTEDLPPAHIVDGDNSEAQEVDSCEAQPTLTSPDSQAQGNEERAVIEEEPREDEAPPEREEVEPTDSVPIQEQPEIECDSIHPAPDLEAANKNHSEEEHPEGSSDESIILEEPPSKDFDIRHVKTDNVLIKTESEHLHYLVMDGKEVAKIENTLNIWTIESMKVQGYTLLCQREVVHCDVLTSHTAYIIVDEKRKERGRVNMGRVEWTEGINYKFRKVIARGGYAIIVEGWQSDRVYAIKLDRSEYSEARISMGMSKNEVSRAGVISTKEVFSIRDITEKEDDVMVSVMERADCTLDHFIRERSSTFRIQQVMQQLAEAVQGIHKGKVIHLDLRSSNILMVRDKPKIADWGLARYISQEWIYVGSGTPAYSAPEVLLKEDEGNASDVYSLACIFYEILLGETMEEVPERAMKQEKTFNDAIWQRLKKVNDYGMRLLLSRMMSRQPRSRPSIESVVNTLKGLRGNTK
ncbi:hypothetical protein PROFUN_02385 [Planoprotostelium fungivorum]|uniref:DNA 3'-5' helicase n=1 Tax=Planoprotostelium fungivorum TaxID=1890364 RepID=A0A2P6NUN4_9EUKA|nr:hypothetical protein PROFUN_02385 [Planoprotostelium fungivorum]